MNPPLVSVIIPTYNRKAYVQQAIDSVLAQTYPHYEIIVVDDGSTDGTGEALAARYGDRITYHWQENQGESAARNWGINIAKGEYIAFLDSDDLWYPNKLEVQVEWLNGRKNIGFLTCLGEAIDSEGELVPELGFGQKALYSPLTYEQLYKDYNVGSPSCVVVPKPVLEKAGGFDERIRYGEDWDLFLKIAAIGDIENVPEILTQMRIHSNGQWYFPRLERTTSLLTDHIRIIENGYRIWPERQVDADVIRANLLASEYGSAGLEYYAFGKISEGDEAIKQALALDPTTWRSSDKVKEMIYRLALQFSESAPKDHAVGRRCVKDIIYRIKEIDSTIFIDPETVCAQLILELSYHHAERNQRSRAMLNLVDAIKIKPSYLRDKGVLFQLTKLIFGDTTAELSRGVYRRIGLA